MKSDIELLGVEDYLRDNADRIIRSLNLIFIGMSRDTPLGLCGQFLCGWYKRTTRDLRYGLLLIGLG